MSIENDHNGTMPQTEAKRDPFAIVSDAIVAGLVSGTRPPWQYLQAGDQRLQLLFTENSVGRLEVLASATTRALAEVPQGDRRKAISSQLGNINNKLARARSPQTRTVGTRIVQSRG